MIIVEIYYFIIWNASGRNLLFLGYHIASNLHQGSTLPLEKVCVNVQTKAFAIAICPNLSIEGRLNKKITNCLDSQTAVMALRIIPQSARECHRIYNNEVACLYVGMMEKFLINWQRRPWEPVGLWRQKLMSSRSIFADGESWKRASSTHKTLLLVKFILKNQKVTRPGGRDSIRLMVNFLTRHNPLWRLLSLIASI